MKVMKLFAKLRQRFVRNLEPPEFEKVAMEILEDHQARNAYQILKEAEKRSGKFLPSPTLNRFLDRLEEEGRLESWWGPAAATPSLGRQYRLRE